jgi:purine-binding chemotaxis protein CheW
MRIVSFLVAGDRGAIDAGAVREIARMVHVAPLSGAPEPVEGVVVVRGEPVPVLDLRARLGLPPRTRRESDYLIVAAAGGRTVALRVDDVEDVAELPDAAVRGAAGMLSAAPTVAGVARLDDGLLLVHDVDRFLSRSEAEVLDVAMRRHATVDTVRD